MPLLVMITNLMMFVVDIKQYVTRIAIQINSTLKEDLPRLRDTVQDHDFFNDELAVFR